MHYESPDCKNDTYNQYEYANGYTDRDTGHIRVAIILNNQLRL
jgi:hypothetical protein